MYFLDLPFDPTSVPCKNEIDVHKAEYSSVFNSVEKINNEKYMKAGC